MYSSLCTLCFIKVLNDKERSFNNKKISEFCVSGESHCSAQTEDSPSKKCAVAPTTSLKRNATRSVECEWGCDINGT